MPYFFAGKTTFYFVSVRRQGTIHSRNLPLLEAIPLFLQGADKMYKLVVVRKRLVLIAFHIVEGGNLLLRPDPDGTHICGLVRWLTPYRYLLTG